MYSAITDYIKELFGNPEFVALHEPRFNGNEKKYLNDCIETGYVSSVGKYVNQFEIELAKYIGAERAVVVVNGTEALHLILHALSVGINDEVITQPLSFIATSNAISYTGASPVFVDVDRETMGMSPESLTSFLNKYAQLHNGHCYNKETDKRIAACVPMHTFGHPARITELKEICENYHIDLIEDAAESLGSTYRNINMGLFGLAGVLSFNGNKTITTGGGGAIVTNDQQLADRLKHLSTQAKVPHQWEYRHDQIGFNHRMPNINAALGLAQLEQLDSFVQSKRALASKYKNFFEGIKGISFFVEPEDAKSNYWLNTVILSNRKSRDEFLEFTNGRNVMTRPIWTLMYKLPMFEKCCRIETPNSDWLEDRVVNIPSSAVL